MKKQLPDLINIDLNTISKIISFKNIMPVLLGIMFLLASCKNDIETINSLTNISELPQQSAKNIEVVYTDSGLVTMKMIARELNRFSEKKEPYSEFPKGVDITFFNEDQVESSHITSNYAIFHEETELWEARYDVVAKAEDGKILYTEYLVWDENKEKIYSDQYVKVIDQGVVMQGIGFESNQEFTSWRILKPTGEIDY